MSRMMQLRWMIREAWSATPSRIVPKDCHRYPWLDSRQWDLAVSLNGFRLLMITRWNLRKKLEGND